MRRRQSLERLWMILVLAWSGVRIGFAEAYMAKYGINIWIFILVEAISSPFLAWSSPRVIRAAVAKSPRALAMWSLIAFASYAVPDVYLLTAGRGVPWNLYAIIVSVMTVLGVATSIRMSREVARGVSVPRD